MISDQPEPQEFGKFPDMDLSAVLEYMRINNLSRIDIAVEAMERNSENGGRHTAVTIFEGPQFAESIDPGSGDAGAFIVVTVESS